MDHQIVIKIKFFLTIIFFTIPLLFFGQNDSFYSLEKNGKKFPKIVRYLLLDNGEKINNANTVIFNINKQQFKHNLSKHKRDTCSVFFLKKIKPITTNQLFKDEFKEHLKRTKTEGIKIPLPLSHYNSRVYIIEKFRNKKIILYEVNWVYSIP